MIATLLLGGWIMTSWFVAMYVGGAITGMLPLPDVVSMIAILALWVGIGYAPFYDTPSTACAQSELTDFGEGDYR